MKQFLDDFYRWTQATCKLNTWMFISWLEKNSSKWWCSFDGIESVKNPVQTKQTWNQYESTSACGGKSNTSNRRKSSNSTTLVSVIVHIPVKKKSGKMKHFDHNSGGLEDAFPFQTRDVQVPYEFSRV